MTWTATRLELRVHPTAVVIVETWIDHPGMHWKWTIQGDTAVKFGYADTSEQAQADALAWWDAFAKTAARALHLG